MRKAIVKPVKEMTGIWVGYYPTETNHLAVGERNPRGQKPWKIRTRCGQWLSAGQCELGLSWRKTCKKCIKGEHAILK